VERKEGEMTRIFDNVAVEMMVTANQNLERFFEYEMGEGFEFPPNYCEVIVCGQIDCKYCGRQRRINRNRAHAILDL
jgi:hypothetical protein